MEQNVGGTDQTIRIAAGMLLAIIGAVSLLGQALTPIVGAILLVVGAVLLYTGYTRQCMLYAPFGINTKK